MENKDILDKIIALTFTRHANLSEEDFLKAIKKEKAKDEQTAVREGKMALITANTKAFLLATKKIQAIAMALAIGLDLDIKDFRKE